MKFLAVVQFLCPLILATTATDFQEDDRTPLLYMPEPPVTTNVPNIFSVDSDPLNYLYESTLRISQLKFVLELGGTECYFLEIPPTHTVLFKANIYYDDAGPNAEWVTYYVRYVNNDTLLAREYEDSDSEYFNSYTFKHESEAGGTYSICMENSHVSAKVMELVAGYYKSFDKIPEVEEKYLQQSNLVVANFMTSMSKLEEKIDRAIQYLAHFRTGAAHGQKMQHGSQHFMTAWSILQCLIIAGTGWAQVYFLKRFFDEEDERNRKKMLRTTPGGSAAAATGRGGVGSQRSPYAI